MSQVGDIFEVVITYRDLDMKVMENAFFYRARQQWDVGITNLCQAIAEYVNTNLITARLAWTPNSFTYTSVRVRNLFDPAESYDMAISRIGTRSLTAPDGNVMPTFVAAKVTMSTSNGLVRKGRKMLAGMLEGDQINGLLTAIGITNFTLFAATIMTEIVNAFLPAQYSLVPVVVKRIRSGTPGNYTYRLPENSTEAIYGIVQSAVLSAIVTTQNSRKD